MVIQCPECRTRFKLADEKIKPDGVKVRCARCKNVFLVQSAELQTVEPPPETLFAETVSGGVLTAATGMGAPPLNESFAGGNWAEPATPGLAEGGFGAEPAGNEDPFGEELEPARDASGSEEEGQEDELSWEPQEDFAPDSPSQEVEFEPSAAIEEDPFAEEFRPGTEEEEGSGPFSDPFALTEEEGKGEEPFSFGTPVAASAPAEEREEFSFTEETDAPGDFSFSAVSSLDRSAPSWEAPGDEESLDPFAPASPGMKNDEFDFGSVSFPEEPSGTASETAPPAPDPEIPLPAALPASPSAAAPKESAAVKKRPASARKPKKKAGAFFFLLFLLLGLTAAGAYLYMSGALGKAVDYFERLMERPAPPPPAPSQIRLIDLKGFFVQNAHEGQLFAITGQAVNDHAEARSAIAVKGILYDDKGQSLLQQTVFAGNPLTEATLKEATFSKIEENMNNQFGDSLSNLNVPPGKAIPFTIVFKGLPPRLSEFTVEIADSRPGSR